MNTSKCKLVEGKPMGQVKQEFFSHGSIACQQPASPLRWLLGFLVHHDQSKPSSLTLNVGAHICHDNSKALRLDSSTRVVLCNPHVVAQDLSQSQPLEPMFKHRRLGSRGGHVEAFDRTRENSKEPAHSQTFLRCTNFKWIPKKYQHLQLDALT
jgi:hypothetical protein